MAFTVLAVCLGNVCRSPVVERMLRMRLDERFSVSSAGVRALQGSDMHPWVRDGLSRAGADPDGFVARQVTESMVRDADLVLTATAGVRTRVLEDTPIAMRRTFTVLDLAALVTGAPDDLSASELVSDADERRSSVHALEHDVPDPIGGPPELFARVTTLLDDATRQIADALAATR